MDSVSNAFPAELLRLNAICPYFTMFPLHFPLSLLRRARVGQRVLDPFCGRGTTNFAARVLGLSSLGLDSNPVAAAIASAKLVSTTAEKIVSLCTGIIESRRSPQDVPQGEFWSLAFAPKTLIEICKLREHLLRNCHSEEALALRALILGALHGPRNKAEPSYFSNQMPRTYSTKPLSAVNFWRSRRPRPKYVGTLAVISRRAARHFSAPLPRVQGTIVHADARSVSLRRSKRFDWIITSPPYLGMRSYVPDQWLRNWFLGGPDTVSYLAPFQLATQDPQRFVDDLAKVWRNVATACNPNAKLVVRFGCLPSIQIDAHALLKMTFEMAHCGWRIKTIKDAGMSSEGNRQSNQFLLQTSSAFAELDLYARLEA